MLRVHSFIASVVALAFTGQTASGQWQEYNGHWYRLTTVTGLWEETEAEAVTNGGHLVTINDADETTWLVENFPHPGPGVVAYWIGLYQDTLDGNYSEPSGGWKWISGEALTYTSWDSGEPNDGQPAPACGPENWAHLHRGPNQEQAGLWNDLHNVVTCPPGSRGIIERDTPPPPVPAASTWGLAVFALLILAAATVVIRRQRWTTS